MAVLFDNQRDGAGLGTSYSFTVGTDNERFMVAYTRSGGGDGDGISAVSYGGQAMTLIATSIQPTDISYVKFWYLINPPSGANNVVITNSTGFTESAVASYSGIRQFNPINAFTTETAMNTSTPSVSVTTTARGTFIVGCLWGGSGPVAGSGTTKRNDYIYDLATEKDAIGTYTINVTGGDSNSDWAEIATAVRSSNNSSSMFLVF